MTRPASVRIPFPLLVLVLVGLGPLGPSAPAAQTWFPLSVGNEWEYENTAGTTETWRIDRTEVILGTPCAVRRELLDGQIVENFWTADTEGDLYLHGARNFLYGGFEAAYVPPIKIIDAPLSVGKSWTTLGVLNYYLDGTPGGGDPRPFPVAVLTEEVLTVPAGTFTAYGIAFQKNKATPGGAFDIFGRYHPGPADPAKTTAEEWYAEGVGSVQHVVYSLYDDPVRLQSTNVITPVDERTWSGVKRLYR